jgi:3-phenylpropionate/trans-cinnamate dioxygenase ferredoxin reductase component
MTHARTRVVIVGAGHAGGTFAALARQAGFTGEVIVFGDEPYPPYHRPPLSKEFLRGPVEKWLRDSRFYAEQDVTLRLGEAVAGIDSAAGAIATVSGETCGYDHLVIATGAAPRRLAVPGGELDGVLRLRSLDDGRALRRRIADGAAVMVVGGGYVGLEVAAAAREHGARTTVIERERRVLARVASPALSAIIEGYHAARGTAILTGCHVSAFQGSHGRLRQAIVATDDGSERQVPADVAVVGVGVVPRDELARRAGLRCDDGIVVDESARTSDPRILAIGDVTSRPVHGTGDRMRLESIPSAVEQAGQAVAAIMGTDPREPEVPWFWSDQFDMKLKIAGILRGWYETVSRGRPGDGRFALFHHRDGLITAVETANSPADFMAGRRMLAARQPVDPARLADPSVGLRELTPV